MALIDTYAQELVNDAAQVFGVSVHRLTSDFRDEPLPLMRNLVAQELRLWGLSFESIGKLLNRDHATILSGLRKLPDRRRYPKPNEIEVFAKWDEFLTNKQARENQDETEAMG